MSRYFVNKDVEQPNPMAALYHREWITKIKKSLGSKCIFLQHVRRNHQDKEDEYFLEARFAVKGGKKRITFKIEGTPSDVSNQNYLDLQQQLLGYARTEKLI